MTAAAQIDISKIKEGDTFTLQYLGQDFPYKAKNIEDVGLMLVHQSETPLGYPMGAIPIENMHNYNFRR